MNEWLLSRLSFWFLVWEIFWTIHVIALPEQCFCYSVLRSSNILRTKSFQVSKKVGESTDNQLPGQSKCGFLTSYYKNITHIIYLIFMTEHFLYIHSSFHWIWLFQTSVCLTVFLLQALRSIKLTVFVLFCLLYNASLDW